MVYVSYWAVLWVSICMLCHSLHQWAKKQENFVSSMGFYCLLCFVIWGLICPHLPPPPSLVLLQCLQPWWAEQNLGWWFITGRVLSIQMRGYNQQWRLFWAFLLYFASTDRNISRTSLQSCAALDDLLSGDVVLQAPVIFWSSGRSFVLTACEALLACTCAKCFLSWWSVLVLCVSQLTEQFKEAPEKGHMHLTALLT